MPPFSLLPVSDHLSCSILLHSLHSGSVGLGSDLEYDSLIFIFSVFAWCPPAQRALPSELCFVANSSDHLPLHAVSHLLVLCYVTFGS